MGGFASTHTGILEKVLPALRQQPGSVVNTCLGGTDMTDDTAFCGPPSPQKLCTRCNHLQPLVNFPKAKRYKYGRSSWCHDCTNAYRSAWERSNPEKRCAVYKKYRNTHRESISAYKRAHYAEHRESERARCKAWAQLNQDKVRAKCANRRARLSDAGTHTASDVAAQYARQKGRCFYCDVRVDENYHVDHVVPLIKGGSNGPENLVIACPTCNHTKHAKHPMDFCGRLL